MMKVKRIGFIVVLVLCTMAIVAFTSCSSSSNGNGRGEESSNGSEPSLLPDNATTNGADVTESSPTDLSPMPTDLSPMPPNEPPNFRGTPQEIADGYKAWAIDWLRVGIFDDPEDDNARYLRPPNIIDTRVNQFNRMATVENFEMWYLEFEARTDDLEVEGGNIRWGTFFPDAEGWIIPRNGWHNAHQRLVIAFDGETAELIGTIGWRDEIIVHGSHQLTLRDFLAREGIALPPVYMPEENPTENAEDFPEIAAVYERAWHAAAWFDLWGFPIGNEPVPADDWWFPVMHDEFSTFAELEAYLEQFFTQNVIDILLAEHVREHRLREIDGVLHTQPGDRGTNQFAGREFHEVMLGEYEAIYRIHLEIFQSIYLDEPVFAGFEITDFHLIYVNGRWLFENFWLVV